MNELGYECREEILDLEIKLNGKLALVGGPFDMVMGHPPSSLILVNRKHLDKRFHTRWLNTVHG